MDYYDQDKEAADAIRFDTSELGESEVLARMLEVVALCRSKV